MAADPSVPEQSQIARTQAAGPAVSGAAHTCGHDDFATLDAAWLRTPPEPCDGFDRNLPWFAHLAGTALPADMRLRLWWHRGGAGDVLLPMVEPRRTWRSGRRMQALANYYTALYAPLWRGAPSASALRALCAAWGRDRPRWDVVDIHPLDPASEDFDALMQALRAAGFLTYRYFRFGNWYLPSRALSFAAYWDARPSALRNTYRRKARAYARDGRGRLEIVSGGDALEPALDAYARVYGASWKVPEPYPRFMPGLIRLAARLGWLRLGVAWYDDQPVAAQVWLVTAGRAAIYKLAYDERHAGLSAGTLLTAHLMQHVLDVDRVDEVDYLIGDEPYKRDWMSHRRERWGIVAYNARTWRGCLGALRQSLGEWRRRHASTASP